MKKVYLLRDCWVWEYELERNIPSRYDTMIVPTSKDSWYNDDMAIRVFKYLIGIDVTILSKPCVMKEVFCSPLFWVDLLLLVFIFYGLFIW